MIDFPTDMQIRPWADQGLKGAPIARTLELDERTVAHWIKQKTYQPGQRVKKASQLDPYKGRMDVEFTLSQSQEHWRACHRHAWEYFKGVTAQVMVDNCKTAVLSHALGQTPVLNPRYVDFAQHYGFQIKACGPKKPHDKDLVSYCAS
jgi:hypothetical protein